MLADLINEVCDGHGGIIRQVNGDQYFLTFVDPTQTMMAVEELCHTWRKIVERYQLGISIGIHKGNLNVFRSFVYGDDIHTTVYLTRLEPLYFPNKDEIHALLSRKVVEEFQGTSWERKFRELDRGRITDQSLQPILDEHGAFEFIPENTP